MTIADCYRQVAIEFRRATKSEISNAPRKAELLRDTFEALMRAIESSAVAFLELGSLK